MADLTAEQINAVVQNAMFGGTQWVQAGRQFADGMENSGFSTSNTTGRAGGRGETDAPSYRKYEREYDTEIKLKKMSNDSTKKMLKAFENVSKVITPEMKTFKSDLHSMTNALDQHFEKISDSFDDASKEINFWTRHTTKAGKTVFHVEQQMRHLNSQLEDTTIVGEERLAIEKKLLEVNQDRAVILKSANTELQRFNKMLAAGAVLGAGAMRAGGQMMSDVEAQRRFGTPGSMGQQFTASTTGGLTGVDPALISELAATNRAAVISMGGAENMAGLYERLGSNLDELANIAGTRDEALKFQMTSYQNLVRAGIKPTEEALKDQVKSLEFANEAMGMTAEEFSALQTQLVTDVEFRRTLNGLDERTRRNRLQSLNDQIATNRANGMMRDQAIAAAVALEDLAGKGPRDRFKDMARLQAVGAMAGVQMSEEARQAFILGKSASAEQRAARQEFMSEMGNSLTEIQATMGGTGTELGIFAALDKAGHSMSDFDNSLTNIGDQLKMEDGPEKFERNFKRMVEQMSWQESAFNDLTTATEKVVGVFTNVAGGGLLSGLVDAIGPAIGGFLGAKGLTGLAGMFGKGGAATATAAGGIGAMGTVAGAIGGSGVALGAAGAGAIALGVGTAAATGGLVGTLLNKIPEWAGFDSISTNIVDGIENMGWGASGRASELLQKEAADAEAANQRALALQLQEKQVLEAERNTETLKVIAELNSKQITTSEFQARMARITAMGQSTGLANE